MDTRDRIRKFRNEKGLSTNDLSKMTGISQSTLSKIENGKRKIDTEILQKIAEALGVSTDKLTGESVSSIIEDRLEEMGATLDDLAKKSKISLQWLQNIDSFVPGQADDLDYEGPLEWDSYIGDYKSYKEITKVAKVLGLPGSQLRSALARQEAPAYEGPILTPEEAFKALQEDFAVEKFSTSIDEKTNITTFPLPTNVVRIPVLGSIPAGYAVEAVEDIIEWIDIPEEWTHGGREYFGLNITGDSMYPEYLENDTAVIRKQPYCDSGDDCAVMVNSTDATLKRININENSIELEAINKMYGKRKFTNKEVEEIPVRILGVVVELRRKKKK